MTLRKKTLSVVVVSVIGLILILYAISRAVLLDNYLELEEQSARRNVARVVDALDAELANLNNMAGDWSAWDDTYAFVQDRDEAYIQDNLADVTFENLRVSLMLFIDDEGQVVFEKAYDVQLSQEVPVHPAMHAYISSGDFLRYLPDTSSSRAGILLIDGDPMLVAMRPILTSELEGPIAGTLLFGRKLNDLEIERLMSITHLKFSFEQFDDPQLSQLPIDPAGTASDLPPVLVKPESREIVAGYTIVKDVFDQPALFLRVELERDIYQQGLNTLAYLGYMLVIVGVVFGLVALFALEKVILTRVANLNEIVRQHGGTNSLSGRLEVGGNDELSTLGKEINKMLDALEKDEKVSRDNERRNLLRAIPDQMFVFTREGKCVDYVNGNGALDNFSRDGFIGKGIHDLGLSQPDLEEASNNIQIALDSKTVRTQEYSLIREEPEHYEARFVAVNEREVLAISRDVTEREKARQALDRSEQLYRSLFEDANDAIFLLTLDGVYTAVNQKAADLLDYRREELIGKTISEIVAPGEHPESMHIKQKLLAGETVPLYERTFQKSDGTHIPVEINASLVLDIDGKPLFIQSIVRDITERKQKEMQIRQQIKRLHGIRNIEQAITSSLDLQLTLEILLTQILDQLGVDAVDILLLNPYSHMLEITSRLGFQTGALRYTRLRLGESFAGTAAIEQRIVHVPDLMETPGSLSQATLLVHEGFRSYYAVPLLAKGHVKGVLEIFHRTTLETDPEWEDFLGSLAAQAAIAIDNAELFRDLQKANLELGVAYDATLEGWAKALELRDKETEGHSQRVTEMTLTLATAIGLRDEELVHLRRGALLHDIGKMGIPDQILLKPGPLTEEEWAIMRQHPVYAYDMLSSIAYLHPALDIAYCHHEKWDGTGYPRGIKGAEIPLGARIFAIVDVWDALSSDRPYRNAWSREEVITYLQAQSGTHFDPLILKKFLEISG